MPKIRHIFFPCPDSNTPCGGIHKIYTHVDILSELGFKAYVLHRSWGFRCDWFQNSTPIVYATTPQATLSGIDGMGEKYSIPPFGEGDILVIPEIFAPQMVPLLETWNTYGIIYNQNAYLTFRNAPISEGPFLAEKEKASVYLNPRILGTFVVSDDTREFLRLVFPKMAIYQIHNSVDGNIFNFQEEKKKQIAFMPRRNLEDIQNVIEMLKERNRIKDWTFYPIHDVPESKVATILKESALFLSFSNREGFGMPPAEAMACGCVVIGYHGQGGKEYIKHPYAHVIESGDVIHFVMTIEKVALDFDYYKDQGKIASEFILSNYSVEQERNDFKAAWEKIDMQMRHV